MAHRKRRRAKHQRAGCLLCKPQKLSAAKKATRGRRRRDAVWYEMRAAVVSDREM